MRQHVKNNDLRDQICGEFCELMYNDAPADEQDAGAWATAQVNAFLGRLKIYNKNLAKYFENTWMKGDAHGE